MKNHFYTNLHGNELDLSSFNEEEAALFESARRSYEQSPEWLAFKQKWLNEVVRYYDRQNVARRETTVRPLFQAIQDLGSRLMVRAGKARLPNYRSQLLTLIEAKFETRREFCNATGVSEDMLSHVLHGRKDLSIGALEDILGKIGYGLSLVPLPKSTAG